MAVADVGNCPDWLGERRRRKEDGSTAETHDKRMRVDYWVLFEGNRDWDMEIFCLQ